MSNSCPYCNGINGCSETCSQNLESIHGTPEDGSNWDLDESDARTDGGATTKRYRTIVTILECGPCDDIWHVLDEENPRETCRKCGSVLETTTVGIEA